MIKKMGVKCGKRDLTEVRRATCKYKRYGLKGDPVVSPHHSPPIRIISKYHAACGRKYNASTGKYGKKALQPQIPVQLYPRWSNKEKNGPIRK